MHLTSIVTLLTVIIIAGSAIQQSDLNWSLWTQGQVEEGNSVLYDNDDKHCDDNHCEKGNNNSLLWRQLMLNLASSFHIVLSF